MPAWCSSRTSSPASRSVPTTAATAQKCVRAGGKHNDLDNVGYTARHHTFFEMLGNFSFGDYFKERAIELAWNLITKEFGHRCQASAGHRLSRGRRGASACGRRSPAFRRPDHPHSDLDNFWAMGDTGPCGPCSEIFYDHGDQSGAALPARSRRGWRPLHRDLEPRLHAVRAGDEGRARRPAASVDRYRHGPGARRRGAAGQARQLRDRPLPRADRREPRSRLTGVKADGRAEGQPPRHRRSSAGLGLPDRRWRAAVE